jgi:hypothetical protein
MTGIAAGSILIAERANLPASVTLQTEPYSTGWSSVKGTHAAFESEVQAAGWTSFFMAGEIHATVFGFDQKKALGTALTRLMTDVNAQACNGIEITQVTNRSFLKVPYVYVTAHPRHLQRGITFSGTR